MSIGGLQVDWWILSIKPREVPSGRVCHNAGTRAPFGRWTWLDFYILSLIAASITHILCYKPPYTSFPRLLVPGRPISDRDLERTQCNVTQCQTDTMSNYLGRGPKPSSDLVFLMTEIDVKSQGPERWRLEACHQRHRWTGIKFKL